MPSGRDRDARQLGVPAVLHGRAPAAADRAGREPAARALVREVRADRRRQQRRAPGSARRRVRRPSRRGGHSTAVSRCRLRVGTPLKNVGSPAALGDADRRRAREAVRLRVGSTSSIIWSAAALFRSASNRFRSSPAATATERAKSSSNQFVLLVALVVVDDRRVQPQLVLLHRGVPGAVRRLAVRPEDRPQPQVELRLAGLDDAGDHVGRLGGVPLLADRAAQVAVDDDGRGRRGRRCRARPSSRGCPPAPAFATSTLTSDDGSAATARVAAGRAAGCRSARRPRATAITHAPTMV